MCANYSIPPAVTFEVEGCAPVIFSRESMTNDISWLRLCLDYDMGLQRIDFVEEDDYLRYWLLSSGLLDYANAIISGPEGEGKSLIQAVLTYQILRLFPEKRGTLDWSPPKRNVYITDAGRGFNADCNDKYIIDYVRDNDIGSGVPLHFLSEDFGLNFKQARNVALELQLKGLVKLDTVPEFQRCDRLLDDIVAERLQDDLNKTAEFDEEIPQSVLNNLLVYNRVFGCDECDRWGDKSNRTKFTMLMGRLINRRRHYHTTFLLVYIDPKGVDGRLIWDRRTHVITAQKIAPDTCEYRVMNRRTGKTHWMTLHPSDWTHLWDTHNISAVSHNVKLNLGSSAKNKKEEMKQVV